MSFDALDFVLDPAHRLPAGFKHRAVAQSILIEVANDLRASKQNVSDLSQEQLAALTGHDRKTIGLAQRELATQGVLKQLRPARRDRSALWTIDPLSPVIMSKSPHQSVMMSKSSHHPVNGEEISPSSTPAQPVENVPMVSKSPHHEEAMMGKSLHHEGVMMSKSPHQQANGGEIDSSSDPMMGKNGLLPQVPIKNKNKEQSVDPVENSDRPQLVAKEQPPADRRPSPTPTPTPQIQIRQALARKRAAYDPNPHGNRAVVSNLAFDLFGQRRPLSAPQDDDGAVIWEETTRMENELRDACEARTIRYDTAIIAYAVGLVRQVWAEEAQAWEEAHAPPQPVIARNGRRFVSRKPFR